LTTLRVALALLPNASPLVYAAGVEPLLVANRLLGEPRFEISHCTLGDRLGSGLSVLEQPLPGPEAPVPDWLLVCGGTPAQYMASPQLVDWLRRRGRECLALGGLAAGGMALAEAGLLDGYRAALHWWSLSEVRSRFPGIRLSNELFSVDRGRFTCRGGTAAQDMVIWMIGRELGADVAEALSHWFVRERAGEQVMAERALPGPELRAQQPVLDEVVALMEANIEEPLSAEDLAGHAGISRRQLERLFRRHLDTVPSRYYLQIRLERARDMVCRTSLSITDIALACGFSSGAHFSNTYRNVYGLTPSEDRERG